MKATVLNGCLDDQEFGNAFHETVLAELASAGYNAIPYILREEKIAPCMGCFVCWIKTPGICVMDDAARRIAQDVVQSDVLIYITPVTFGGYSSELKKALDRNIPIILPFFQKIKGEIHHKARYDHYPNLLVIGYLDKPNPEYEETFNFLAERNALNMHNGKTLSEIFLKSDRKESIQARIEAALSEIGEGI